jgi:hypothetical protein
MTGAVPIDEQHTGHHELAASSLAFLYAHRWAAPAKAGTVGMVSPANGSVVQTVMLGRRLFSVAVWWLHQGGAGQFETFTEKHRRYDYSDARVRMLKETEVGGIEGDLMATLRRLRGEKSYVLSNLASRYRGPKPEADMVQRAIEDAVAQGYGEYVSTGVGWIKHRVTHESRRRLEWDRERIASLEPAAGELVQRYNRFAEQQPDLERDLWQHVVKAFERINTSGRKSALSMALDTVEESGLEEE